MIPYDDLLPSDVSIIEDFAAVSNWIRGRRGFGALRADGFFGFRLKRHLKAIESMPTTRPQ